MEKREYITKNDENLDEPQTDEYQNLKSQLEKHLKIGNDLREMEQKALGTIQKNLKVLKEEKFSEPE